MKTYTELSHLHTLEDRFDYLSLGGIIGETTFGFERYLNQRFYNSREWKSARNEVIVRDLGMDFGIEDFPIRGNIYVHHMNPLTMYDIEEGTSNLLDPEFLISCSLRVHNAVHYSDKSQLPRVFVDRRPGDTNLWSTRKGFQ